MEKNLEISLLFDFYGQMLTSTQQEAVSLYFNDDLSLKETADILGMSRQGVRDALSRAQKSLYSYEENLGLYNRFSKTQEGLEEIIKNAKVLFEKAEDGDTKDLSDRILHTALRLYEQEV